MNITAFAIGSYGDVQPFVVLGKELKRKGHNFKIVTFSKFEKNIIENGIDYGLFHGDVEEMMRTLLSESKGSKSGIKGIQMLLEKNPEIYDDLLSACKGSDLVIYMQFGALAYHFAEKIGVPCVRTFVFPWDPTKLYAPLFTSVPRNTLKCKFTYYMSDIMMNVASKKMVNTWRKKLGLKKWGLFSSYKKVNGAPILTLYQYSQAIVPRDPKWGKHINITGPWLEEERKDYVPDKKLIDFLEEGEPPIYFGFGSMVYSEMDKLQSKILEALKRTGQRAIFVSSWSKFEKDDINPNVHYTDYVPFSWLFPRVKAVVHHGGYGTTNLGLEASKPTLIMAFGADQMFWGMQVNELGAGPKPINIKKEIITVELLECKFLELEKDEYVKNASKISGKLKRENGCENACNIIESYLKKIKDGQVG